MKQIIINFIIIIFLVLLTISSYAKDTSFAVQWDTKYESPTDKEGNLIITNVETGSKFKMTYKDFFILKKAYKNWRTVEVCDPVITDVIERQKKDADGKKTKEKEVVVIFNYFDENNKSILSGQFIVDPNYLTVETNKDKEAIKTGALVGTTVYSILTTIVIILAIAL